MTLSTTELHAILSRTNGHSLAMDVLKSNLTKTTHSKIIYSIKLITLYLHYLSLILTELMIDFNNLKIPLIHKFFILHWNSYCKYILLPTTTGFQYIPPIYVWYHN